jgi:hypothetical protein
MKYYISYKDWDGDSWHQLLCTRFKLVANIVKCACKPFARKVQVVYM